MSLSKSRFIEMFGNVATNNKRWEKTKLGNKSVIGSSKRIFANEYTTEGIPFYRSKEIIELGMGEKPSVELYISKKRYQEIKEKFGIPIPGDILMTAVGTIGKFWIVPNSKPFYYKDGNLVYIRTKEFNPLFLKKLLEMLIEKYKVENANGSAYTALTIEKLKDLQIVLPPMTLQKQYEEFYIQIDKLKFLLQKILEKLELLKKSRFIEMFGDINLPNTKWKMTPLGKNATLFNGRAYKQEELLDSGKYKLLRVGNFFSTKDWYYSDLELEADKYCDTGDLLFAWSASFGAKIWDQGKVIYHYHIWKVIPNENYNKEFLCFLLNEKTESLKKQTHGSTMMHLTKIGMEQTLFIVPPISLQNQFVDFIHQIDKLKLVIQKSLEDLVGKS